MFHSAVWLGGLLMNSYLRMASLAAALLWAAPQNGNAAILTYTYQGTPLYWQTSLNGPWVPSGFAGFTGSITIDEFLLSDGTIANHSFGWFWHAGGDCCGQPDRTIPQTNPTGVLSASYARILNGYLGIPGGGHGSFSISFDQFGMPIHWSGSNMLGYVYDPSTHDGFDDLNSGGHSLTAGTWTLTGVPTLAPVPLPATLPLFASGLGALGLLAWRRKRNDAAALAA